jgi:hypothetical protein
MSKTNLPGFTADASLYKTSKPYGVAARLEAMRLSRTVYPQRVTGPGGPIGLPGQDCAGACWHMCMTFGGGQRCLDNCMSTCSGVPSGLTTIGGLI